MGDLGAVLRRIDDIRDDLTALYKDLHAHPELSFAEHRTAAEIARRLEVLGLEVTTGVGRTGVVGVLRNGDGPTVLLRADFDALPVQEQTGLDYASAQRGTDPDGHDVPVMHACGHDMHVTCQLGALDLLVSAREQWSGTVVAVFQPAEEIGAGAQAMLDDGLLERFPRPDVCLGQHVFPFPAGTVGVISGPSMSAADGLKITMFGRGAHGSQPENAIDPVVMASATVLRLQTVVSREVSARDTAVVTVGSIRAGTKDNIIPDQAELRVNIRSFDEAVRERVIAAVKRIVRAEAIASGAEREPEFERLTDFPVLVNDPQATDRTTKALCEQLGAERVLALDPVTGSEDVGLFGTAAGVPTCYWFFGGVERGKYLAAREAGTLSRDVPSNHSPFFAPVVEPTLTTGVTAMATAALAWLDPR
ncbi:hippurate hydrolase [Saccharopolyspora antimicrobica]|uniref:Hippurate hydrolase n=1 Tax=Saccharopolyspora antimicrobica TaxID=455193 RepID=A0A1I5I394_9PSEU|nr:amidohydrolase [Saccharopolyspora antimicrobica]RKT83081.1 hippurate hydrolase [Saccharopolyspora antimicrobica]SFO54660.1 hippurate hydrolase [Saccharopolyspora antimicrobica]